MDEVVTADLTCARKLIEQPEHWTKRVSARNASGVMVSPHSADATKFCLTGAIQHCTGSSFDLRFWACVHRLEAVGAKRGVVNFNDSPDTTHYDVLALIDKALALK